MLIPVRRILGRCVLGALVLGVAIGASAQEGGDWFPFQPVRDEFEPTILDVSAYVEAPTGTRGFVRAQNEGFVFEDGTPARFWGVNLTVVGKTDAVYLVRRLRKLGLNAVRVAWPQPGLGENPLAWERLDFLVAQLGEQGIYLDLNLGGLDSAPPGSEGEPAQGGPTDLAPFYDDAATAQSLQRLRDTAGHRNIYTGRRYCDDPTVALFEIARGATLFSRAVDGLGPTAKGQIEAAFAAWLRQRYGNDGELARAWTVGGHVPLSSDEGLKAKRVGLIPMQLALEQRLAGHPELAKRAQDQMRFFLQLEQRYWTAARDRLREMGVRVPIAGSPVAGVGPGAALRLEAVAGLDDVARGGYWDEPTTQAEGPVTLATAIFGNLPMVRQVGATAGTGNLVLAKSWEQVLGRPLTISDWSTCLPNQFSLEGVGLMAAYGSLQGWDAAFEQGILTPLWVTSLGPDPYNMFANPPQLLQVPAAAVLWHRGDVQEASLVSEAVRGEDEVLNVGAAAPDVMTEAALVGKVGTRFTAAPRPGVLRDISRYWDPRARVARSLTGELEWNANDGLVTVETARSEAWIGFVGGAIRRLSSAALETTTPFGAVYVTALDGQAGIPDARHVLVTAVGPARNQGMTYARSAGSQGGAPQTTWRLEAVGEKPILLQPVVGNLRIRTTHWPNVKAWTLDNTGRRRETIELARDNGFVTLPLQPHWAVVYYELGLE